MKRATKPTIQEVQAFARYHGIPMPDGFIASGRGGPVYAHPENYAVVRVTATDDTQAGGI